MEDMMTIEWTHLQRALGLCITAVLWGLTMKVQKDIRDELFAHTKEQDDKAAARDARMRTEFATMFASAHAMQTLESSFDKRFNSLDTKFSTLETQMSYLAKREDIVELATTMRHVQESLGTLLKKRGDHHAG